MATVSSTAKMANKQPKEKSEKDEILPFDMAYLTPAMIEEARTQLNETDEVKVKALEQLRKLIEGKKNLATPTDDLYLLAFLRSRKFKVKKAFKLLKSTWSFVKEHSHIYDITKVQTTSKVMLQNFLGVLPNRDRNGSTVLIFKVALWDPEQDSFEDIFRAVTGVLNYATLFPATQIAGIRTIYDIRGLTKIQKKYFTPANVMLIIRSSQFCFPAIYRGVHIISDSNVVKLISTIIYPALTSKLRKQIFIHNDSDIETLKDYIHPSVLPAEFGGEAPEFNNSNRQDDVENICKRLEEMSHYGYKN